MKDFNNLNRIWDDNKTNQRGMIIKPLIEENQLCLHNKNATLTFIQEQVHTLLST